MKFDDWVNRFYGKATDYDGVCGVQCVDLIHLYIKYVLESEPQANGNAIDYWTHRDNKYISSKFISYPYKKGMKIQKGDVCVFRSKSGYGHVAVATGEYNSQYFYSYDQNYPRSMHEPMGKFKHDYTNLLGVLRPKNQSNLTQSKTVYKTTKAYLNAYTSSKFGTPSIVIPVNTRVELVKANAGKMKKYGTSYTMSQIKYKSKTYYVAYMYLK